MIKYGSHVAFLSDGAIRFGVIAAIVQRTDAKGERTEYVVTSIVPYGTLYETANSDVTVESEDNIADLGSWRKSEALFELAAKDATYKWAEQKSNEILNPPDLAPAPVESAPIVTDESAPKKDAV